MPSASSSNAVAGYVIILPDTALEKVLPLQNLATLTEPQHGLERVDEKCVQRFRGLEQSEVIPEVTSQVQRRNTVVLQPEPLREQFHFVDKVTVVQGGIFDLEPQVEFVPVTGEAVEIQVQSFRMPFVVMVKKCRWKCPSIRERQKSP